MTVAVGFATDFVVGVFVVALAAAGRSCILALFVGSASVHVRETAASFLATDAGPLTLSIVLAGTLCGVAEEALEEASGREIDVFATSVVNTDILGLELAALHAADLVGRIPDAHGVVGAETEVTFIGALSAAEADGAIPHAAVVTVAGSAVGSDELALGTALELADGPVAHGLAFAVEGVDDLVAGFTAFTRDLIPLAIAVTVARVLEGGSRILGFALAAASFVLENSGAVPLAHGVGGATRFILVERVGQAGVSALADVGVPVASEILTARFRVLVLEQAASVAGLRSSVELAHRGGQAGGDVEERAEASAVASFGIPVAIDLGLADIFSLGAITAAEVAGTVKSRNGVVEGPSAHGVASAVSDHAAADTIDTVLFVVFVLDALVGVASGSARTGDVVPHAEHVVVTRGLGRVGEGAGLCAVEGLASLGVGGETVRAAVPFTALITTDAALAVGEALHLLIIPRATVCGDAIDRARVEGAGTSAAVTFGVPEASCVGFAISGVVVAERTFADAGFVGAPLADAAGLETGRLERDAFAGGAADAVHVPDAARISVASLAVEVQGLALGAAAVGSEIPAASAIGVTFIGG